MNEPSSAVLPTMHPATPMQEGMLFHCIAYPGSGIDIPQLVGVIQEELNPHAFEKAWQYLVERHQALRLRLVVDGQGLVQQFALDSVQFEVKEQDLSHLPPAEQLRLLQAQALQEQLQGFDPRYETSLRVTLFRLGRADYRFLWTIWHGVIDGHSTVILLKELFLLYQALSRGVDLDLQPSRPFTDYAAWLMQREWGDALLYWKTLLLDCSDRGRIGRSHRRELPFESSLGTHEVHLPTGLSNRLLNLRRRNGVTVNALVQGAWALVLSWFAGSEDVVFGITRSCRKTAFDGDGTGADIVGMLANVLPVRVRLDASKSAITLMRELRAQNRSAGRFEHTPPAVMHASSGLLPKETLYDSMVIYEERSYDEAVKRGHRTWANAHFEIRQRTGYPITLWALGSDELSLQIYNDRSRIDDGMARRMLDQLSYVIQVFSESADILLSDVPYSVEESYSSRNPRTSYPETKTFVQLFEEQVKRSPLAAAVMFEADALTYLELDRRSTQLARHLKEIGAGPGMLVGIRIERSMEMMVALLGVLKSGAAYVPLDPEFPEDRLAFMVADARLQVILTNGAWTGGPDDCMVVSLVDGWHAISQQPYEPLQAVASPDDLAYVLYTSGSTGRPKGVEIRHKSLTNFLWSMGREPGCNENDVVLAVTTLSFDIAALELYLPLTVGARVRILGRQVAGDGRALALQMAACQPTLMQATPATWQMLIDSGWQGTPNLKVLCGGEALSPELATQLLRRASALWNMYGPTETTIWSSVHQVSLADTEVSVGRPIANTQFYILDQRLREVPSGVPGELYIGGDGLARGYLNRPDLTANRFIPHPFSDEPGSRLYRTGDAARFSEAGTVIHLGRLDDQIKLRGFRIELGEVEAALSTHPFVGKALVTIREDNLNQKELCAYFIPAGNASPAASELRQHLRGILPEYMLPRHFKGLPSFPLTPNGKIDRKALPPPDLHPSDSSRKVAPRNDTERLVATVWSEAFGIEEIGIHDDFFDLGGHSLLAVRLTRGIAKAFQVDLPLHVLFEAPDIAQLSDRLVAMVDLKTNTAESDQPAGKRAPLARNDGSNAGTLTLDEEREDIAPASKEGAANPAGPGRGARAVVHVRETRFNHRRSLVVCLQSTGLGRPLHLIHAAGGAVFFYSGFASRFKGIRPIYAVRAETTEDGMGQPYESSRTTEDLAKRYIKEIKTIQPEGPYSLGGGCFGGVIAFEMAKQLQAAGEVVSNPVLLFDSYLVNNPHVDRLPLPLLKYFGWRMSIGYRIRIHVRNLHQIGLVGGSKYVAKSLKSNALNLPTMAADLLNILFFRLKRIRSIPLRSAPPEQKQEATGHLAEEKLDERQSRTLQRTNYLLARYRPSAFDGSLVLFKSTRDLDPEPLWQGMGRGGIYTHASSGTHLAMFEEPAVNETVALVNQHLNPEKNASAPGNPPRPHASI